MVSVDVKHHVYLLVLKNFYSRIFTREVFYQGLPGGLDSYDTELHAIQERERERGGLMLDFSSSSVCTGVLHADQVVEYKYIGERERETERQRERDWCWTSPLQS